jgi:hypothetical protein
VGASPSPIVIGWWSPLFGFLTGQTGLLAIRGLLEQLLVIFEWVGHLKVSVSDPLFRIERMFDSTDVGLGVPGATADTFENLTADEAGDLIRSLEVESRRLEASKCDLLAAIGRNGLHDVDGHSSPKVMMRHVAQLSGSEAWARDKVASVMAALGDVAAAYRRGTVGTSQIRRLAKTYSNPRVRHFMPACESVLLEAAMEMEYIEFDLFISQFEELVDEDGADQKA